MGKPTSDARIVVWFSCGAASAMAAKMALDEYRNQMPVEIVYCDLLTDEHPDNRRFMSEVARWLDHEITVIGSSKYGSIEDVWRARAYMAGIKGAPCTVEMKKLPRFAFQKADDIHVFGFTVDEERRIQRLVDTNPELRFDWILFRRGITKQDCFSALLGAGLELPPMYRLGFRNNNCIGCAKASSAAYWDMVREHFPDVFARRAALSRELGARLTRIKGKRIFLDELPADIDRRRYALEDISCGPECGVVGS